MREDTFKIITAGGSGLFRQMWNTADCSKWKEENEEVIGLEILSQIAEDGFLTVEFKAKYKIPKRIIMEKGEG